MVNALLWKLIERFVAGPAVPQINDEMKTTLDIGRTAIEKYWTGNHEIIKVFSDQFIKRQAEEMREEVPSVLIPGWPIESDLSPASANSRSFRF